jgi:predicted AlkP superfamily phosphohydrolase/phosphomutase
MISIPDPDKKVVVLGLDGATFDIIRPMIESGRLKNFAKMMGEGSSGNLISTILPLSSVAWSSFATGRNPAKHGMYDFSKRLPGSYEYAPVTSLDRGAKAIWEYASDAGKRCLIVNVPLTYPPEKINGIMISGFPYPESRRDFAWPRETLEEIKNELGITSILKPNPQFLKRGDEERIAKEVKEITKNQCEIIKYLMEKEPWDLIVSVFDATDVVGHFFWHHIDPNHPKYNENEAKKYGPLFYEVYEQLDEVVGDIASKLDGKDNLFVISDHGFGPVHYAVYMNNWLIKNNYLRLKKSPGTKFRKSLFGLGITSEFVFNTVKKLHLVDTKTNTYSKNSKKVSIAKKITLSTDDIDWDSTLAYASGNYGPIYANLKGREPNGKVEAGNDYDSLISELSRKLKGITDPKSGRLLFDLIYKKDKIYSGPFYDTAPDIVYFDSLWLNYPLRVFEFGSRDLIAPNPIYTGSHRMEGIFIGRGPDIAHKIYLNMNLIDVAPTLMHMLGLSVPADMDGEVLNAIFESNCEISTRPVQYVDESRSSGIRAATQKILRSSKMRI